MIMIDKEDDYSNTKFIKEIIGGLLFVIISVVWFVLYCLTKPFRSKVNIAVTLTFILIMAVSAFAYYDYISYIETGKVLLWRVR